MGAASHLLLTIIILVCRDVCGAKKRVKFDDVDPMRKQSKKVFRKVTSATIDDIEIESRRTKCGISSAQYEIKIRYCSNVYEVEICNSASNTCLLSMSPGRTCTGKRFLKDDCCGRCSMTYPKDFTCGHQDDLIMEITNTDICELELMKILVHSNSSPSVPTAVPPTATPTVAPTAPPPTATPTVAPTAPPPTATPTAAPTATPPITTPTAVPTVAPTALPTLTPTSIPTVAPSLSPTAIPANPPLVIITNRPAGVVTSVPTVTPTSGPTAVPVSTFVPTLTPVGTTKQPVVSTQQPVTSTQQPVISTKQPVVVTGQPVGETKQPEASDKSIKAKSPETLPPSYYPSEGDKDTAAVAQTAVSSGLGVGAVVGSAASPNIALLSAITNSLDCMGDQSHGDGVREESNLSFFLHPLRFRVEGSPHAGSIVGNICFSFVVALIVTAVVRVVMKRKDLTYEMASATLRYPSCTEIMPMFLYGSILQSSLEMILYPRGTFFVILSTVGLLCCLVFAYVVWKVGEPTKFAATIVGLHNAQQVPGWKKYFFGTAAWKSDSDEPQFVERQGIFFDVYRQVRWKIFNNGRYMVFEILILFPVTVISIIRAKSFTACAVKAFSMATVMLIACIVHWINEPFIIPFLNQLMLMVQVASLLSLILFGVGYVKEDMKTWEITTGYYLITLSLGLAMVRVVYDVLMWLLSVRSNYRKELLKTAAEIANAHDDSIPYNNDDIQNTIITPLMKSLPFDLANLDALSPSTPIASSALNGSVSLQDYDFLVGPVRTITPTATSNSNRPSPFINPIVPPRPRGSPHPLNTLTPVVSPDCIPNDDLDVDEEKFYFF